MYIFASARARVADVPRARRLLHMLAPREGRCACVAVVSRWTCSGPKSAVQRERLLEEDKGAAAPSFIGDKRRRPQGSSLIAAVPILGEKRERWAWGRSGGARVGGGQWAASQ